MSKPIDPSRPLPDEKHEAFAAHFAVNGNAAAAWVHATAGNPAHSDANGSKWRKIGSITARVAWLKAEAKRRQDAEDAKANEAVFLSLAEKRKFAARLVRVNVAELDLKKDGDLLAGIDRVDGSQGEVGVLKLKLSDKLRAIQIDNDLAHEGAQAEGLDAMGQLLERLRK